MQIYNLLLGRFSEIRMIFGLTLKSQLIEQTFLILVSWDHGCLQRRLLSIFVYFVCPPFINAQSQYNKYLLACTSRDFFLDNIVNYILLICIKLSFMVFVTADFTLEIRQQINFLDQTILNETWQHSLNKLESLASLLFCYISTEY